MTTSETESKLWRWEISWWPGPSMGVCELCDGIGPSKSEDPRSQRKLGKSFRFVHPLANLPLPDRDCRENYGRLSGRGTQYMSNKKQLGPSQSRRLYLTLSVSNFCLAEANAPCAIAIGPACQRTIKRKQFFWGEIMIQTKSPSCRATLLATKLTSASCKVLGRELVEGKIGSLQFFS